MNQEVYNNGLHFLNSLVILNALASILTIYLIYDMRLKMNGYLILVTCMTIFQLFFDLNLFLYSCPEEGPLYNTCLVLQIFNGAFFGLGGALFSNVLSCVVAKIVVSKSYFNIQKHIRLIILLVVATSFLLAVSMALYYSFGTEESLAVFLVLFNFYSYLRLSQIIINVFVYIIISLTIRRIRIVSNSAIAQVSPFVFHIIFNE